MFTCTSPTPTVSTVWPSPRLTLYLCINSLNISLRHHMAGCPWVYQPLVYLVRGWAYWCGKSFYSAWCFRVWFVLCDSWFWTLLSSSPRLIICFRAAVFLSFRTITSKSSQAGHTHKLHNTLVSRACNFFVNSSWLRKSVQQTVYRYIPLALGNE